MQTSAIRLTRKSRAAGFTLLEIIVVLVLLGLITSVVAPRLGLIYDSLTLRGQRDELVSQISALPYKAFRSGREIRLDADAVSGVKPLNLPDGWELRTDSPIVVTASGVCVGGSLQLWHESGDVWEYRVEAPFCRMTLLTDG